MGQFEIQREKIHKIGAFQIIVVVAAACLVHGVMQGVHDNYGIMLNGLLSITHVDYAGISFCIGAGALVYGFAQPFLGMLALRKSNVFVIFIGILFTIVGLAITPLCRNICTLFIFFGLVLPFGTTGLCFGIVMGAITPVLGERRAAIVSGIVQASAGIGDALMSPGLEKMISDFGVRTAMTVTAVPFLVMVPVALWLGKKNRAYTVAARDKKTIENQSLSSILKNAFVDRDYRLLLIGFATCGFNMSIIESHLFSQYLSYGISGKTASLTLTVYGIATMTGAVVVGFLGTKFRMKNILGCVYAMRVLISLAFLILPKTVPFAFLATALLGMSGDATVPPTSGIISRKFGAEKMAVLYGFTLIGHQIGAFASSYLGGILVKMNMGYDPLWTINMILAIIASIASFSIRNNRNPIGNV
ncbi:MFS transporter [Ihubacter massiliensis]|uniref:MFS transporter n=1 Tax=Hominibacterium faecale TaxID=2839743 RepID=A0A9J6QYJ9_9FIRM|nr:MULTISPECIES: MFS transporter [Eubacteriales Family XIII. Incertae Sedis]MCO7120419.1 MFS transporter [Ihubacter massiliensis]MCU7380544.1 MFS transporter [Hominibacterium faecale]